MTKTMRLMALGLSVVVFTGCSAVDDLIDEYGDDQEEEYQGYQDDGDTSGGGTNPATGIAYYIDSAVSGVNYKCGSKEGITGSFGEFTFEVGSSCTFYLGDMELRGVDAGLLVNGENVYETDVKIARILQSLDNDGDPSNGITIEATTVQALAEEGISSLPTSEAEMDEMLAVIAANGGTEVSEDDAAVHMLTTLLAGKTLYTGVWGEMATFESMSFASDLKSSSWQEIVDVDDRLDNGNGTLTIDGMIITYTCTYDSGYDNPSECSNEEPFIMTVTEILEDYMLVLSKDEEGEESVNRVYYDEAKAREYFLAGSATVDLTALNTPAEVEKNIIGTWSKGCRVEGAGSESDTFTFAADGTGSSRGTYYHTPGCNPEDKVDSWDNTFTYTIGESTTGANGEAAVEIDHVILENGRIINYYAMVHFTAVNQFIIGDDEENDGSNTPETRANVFLSKDVFLLTGSGSTPTTTSTDFETMLTGKTLYQVWYGMGVDANGNDIDNVAVVAKVTFNLDGTAEFVGLMNEGTGSGKWEVSNDKLVLVALADSFNYTEYNQYVSGDIASGCIQTNWINENDPNDNNIDLFFTDETVALNYANNLTSTAHCP